MSSRTRSKDELLEDYILFIENVRKIINSNADKTANISYKTMIDNRVEPYAVRALADLGVIKLSHKTNRFVYYKWTYGDDIVTAELAEAVYIKNSSYIKTVKDNRKEVLAAEKEAQSKAAPDGLIVANENPDEMKSKKKGGKLKKKDVEQNNLKPSNEAIIQSNARLIEQIEENVNKPKITVFSLQHLHIIKKLTVNGDFLLGPMRLHAIDQISFELTTDGTTVLLAEKIVAGATWPVTIASQVINENIGIVNKIGDTAKGEEASILIVEIDV